MLALLVPIAAADTANTALVLRAMNGEAEAAAQLLRSCEARFACDAGERVAAAIKDAAIKDAASLGIVCEDDETCWQRFLAAEAGATAPGTGAAAAFVSFDLLHSLQEADAGRAPLKDYGARNAIFFGLAGTSAVAALAATGELP